MISDDDKLREEKFLDTLARRVAKIRKAKNMTQEKVAEEAGIERVALANIETGRRRPTARTIHRLAKALSVKVEDIFKNL